MSGRSGRSGQSSRSIKSTKSIESMYAEDIGKYAVCSDCRAETHWGPDVIGIVRIGRR